MSNLMRALALLAAFGLGSAMVTAQPLKQQMSNTDAVTVKATPLKLDGPVWEFELVFDTHSQELNDDLLSTAVLVAPDGSQIRPSGWKGDPPSGHHRKGVLRFNAPKTPQEVVELRVLRTRESAPRTFKWPMPKQ